MDTDHSSTQCLSYARTRVACAYASVEAAATITDHNCQLHDEPLIVCGLHSAHGVDDKILPSRVRANNSKLSTAFESLSEVDRTETLAPQWFMMALYSQPFSRLYSDLQ